MTEIPHSQNDLKDHPIDLAFYRVFYRRYLSKYRFFRDVKPHALRIGRRVRRGIQQPRKLHHFRLSLQRKKMRREWLDKCYRTGLRAKLICFSDYQSSYGGLKSTASIVGRTEIIGGPHFFGGKPDNVRAEAVIKAIRPHVQIAEINEAYALPGTDFILKNGLAIHPDLFLPKRDVCQAERVGTINIRPGTGRLLTSTDAAFRLDSGISLLGQCAGNYAHFLTEVLPKLPIIDGVDEYRGLPLIIDFWIDRNLKDAIRYFNTSNRPIYELNYGQPAFCKRLVFVTPTSYAPPEYREFLTTNTIPRIEHYEYAFSKEALNLLREKARSLTPAADWIGKRLFVHRAPSHYGNGRSAVSSYNIEEAARRAGYHIIEPGALTISEQIAAFREAEVVVTQIGAAMANLVFTKPGCRVICLSPHYKDAEYYYHAMLNEALGHDLSYVTGPQITSVGGHPLHRDYRIDMDLFHEALNEIG